MRAATRKQTEEHRDEMAARAAKRDLRRRRRLGAMAKRAEAREFARRRLEQLEQKFCEPVNCEEDS